MRALKTRKSCAVGMRNAILRNHLNLLLFALFITRLNANTSLIESVARLDQNAKALEVWLKSDSHWKHLFADKSFSSLFIFNGFSRKSDQSLTISMPC